MGEDKSSRKRRRALDLEEEMSVEMTKKSKLATKTKDEMVKASKQGAESEEKTLHDKSDSKNIKAGKNHAHNGGAETNSTADTNNAGMKSTEVAESDVLKSKRQKRQLHSNENCCNKNGGYEDSDLLLKKRYLLTDDACIQKDLLLKQERDRRCIVVKNLSHETVSDDLRGTSTDILEVRVHVQKNKKAEGRKVAFLEFADEESCKKNLKSVKKLIRRLQPEASVDLAEANQKSNSENLVFDTQRLFVKGFEPGSLRSEVESLFPSSASVEGEFRVENGEEQLTKNSVTVSFDDPKKCLRVKNAGLKFKGRELDVSFMIAGERQRRRALKKALQASARAGKKEIDQKPQDERKSEKGHKGVDRPPSKKQKPFALNNWKGAKVGNKEKQWKSLGRSNKSNLLAKDTANKLERKAQKPQTKMDRIQVPKKKPAEENNGQPAESTKPVKGNQSTDKGETKAKRNKYKKMPMSTGDK